MRVAIVAEYYPRASDPVLGVWAHRQALAARDAGADVRVLVLNRPLPPLAALKQGDLAAARTALRQPRRATLDGIEITYVPYLSPPRPWSYATWGAWATPLLGRALRRLHATFPFDLVHAHYAVPAGDAVRRARVGGDRIPLVVSVHGGDVLATAQRSAYAERVVRRTFAHAQVVLANSAGTERRCRALGAHATTVVHLGTDLPAEIAHRTEHPPTLVTVGHLIARKRHTDVIEALAILAPTHPGLRYVIVGDGPERATLEALATQRGVRDRVDFTGQLPPAEARSQAAAADLFVLPSIDEAFGVAYVEAMAASVPAIGCEREDGPNEITAAGPGLVQVPPRNPQALAAEIDRLLGDDEARAALGRHARSTVEDAFTWERCGRQTVAAYERVLANRFPAPEPG
ncbi:MAG TPA: glycosyltransferase [Conexibacter sp.]|jgi:glycosyltransferase involved in cell wall biosynthesis|nr:glycosyltransferase [Conexibacter sp.]